MSDRVEVNPDALRAAAGRTAEVHDRVHDIFTSLQNALSAKGTPWGNDEYGQRFAEGENGYLAQSRNQTGGIATVAATFDGFATAQGVAVTTLLGTEDGNADSFGAGR
ncbi:hypothetical protein [Nocardia sp. BMG111209]|uniref:hypothetical protein n=1 Tax=Nocardia sp. BMG111209 TaxID=1160137 RepID=UPI0003A5348E|nr:hypothetical protein [Nocardia sp. BMG111209]